LGAGRAESTPAIPTGPVVMLSAGTAGVQARPPDSPSFGGTWKLDAARSKIGAMAAPVGLVKSGAPQTLHITHSANGAVVVESQINESQSRAYRPGGKTSTPVVPTGTITMTSRWEGKTLVAEGTTEAGTSTMAVKEVFSIGADAALTIEISLTVGTEISASTLVYTRAQTVGDCKSWPTPCK